MPGAVTNPNDLTVTGYLALREAVARIIVGPAGPGASPEVTPEHKQSAENLIRSGVIDIQAVLPGVK
jgi:hypothetical protein